MEKKANGDFFTVTPEILELTDLCKNHSTINPALFAQYDVKRGLRDINGKGVLTGLTEISDIISSKEIDGKSVPCEGELYYRGINIHDIVRGFIAENRFGFEETTYLLLFGELPEEDRLQEFKRLLSKYRTLPTNFVRDIIMMAPSFDMMNTLASSVLTL